MKTFDQKTVTERFARLPEGVKDVILSDSTTESIREIMKEAGLEGETKSACIEQITLASTGLSTTKDFKDYVMNDMNLDPQKANTLFEKVVHKIFNPVREALLLSLGTTPEEPPQGSEPVSTKDTGSDPYREQTR